MTVQSIGKNLPERPGAEAARPALADIVPLAATEAARDALGDFYAYAAFVAQGHKAAEAEQWTGAPVAVHAARLAAACEHLLSDEAALRVIAAGAIR